MNVKVISLVALFVAGAIIVVLAFRPRSSSGDSQSSQASGGGSPGVLTAQAGQAETTSQPTDVAASVKLVQTMIDACKKSDLVTAKACFGVEDFPMKINGKDTVKNKIDVLLNAADAGFADLSFVASAELMDRVLVKTEHTFKGTIGRKILETVTFEVQLVSGLPKIMAADAKQVYQ